MIAAVPYSSAADSLQVVAHALIFGTPVLFIVFAGAMWFAVGSTLRPIDLLRRGAARVTGAGVPADLPVPEARDEVRLLALTLNDMLSQLAAAQQRQRALVSDTAHELRSPIASIRTQLEVALDYPSGQDWETTARDVHADVLRLARLAEDLLLLARLDEQADLGDAGRQGELIDISELACAVVARYADAPVPVTVLPPDAGGTRMTQGQRPVRRARATLAATRSIRRMWWSVAGNRDRLEQMLVNLIDNAVRYAKSSVTVSVSRSGGWARSGGDRRRPGHSRARPGAGLPRPIHARLDDARSPLRRRRRRAAGPRAGHRPRDSAGLRRHRPPGRRPGPRVRPARRRPPPRHRTLPP